MAMQTTKQAVRAICAADPSVSAAQLKAALAELDGDGIREMTQEPPPRAYSPAQVAALLGKSRRTVTIYAKRGLLTPIYSGAAKKRAQSYTGESVRNFLDGTANAKGVAE